MSGLTKFKFDPMRAFVRSNLTCSSRAFVRAGDKTQILLHFFKNYFHYVL